MAKAAVYEADLLKLLLNATPIANIADNAAASPLTSLYVALHTADPGNGGNQSTSEVAYTGYARQAIARSNSSPAWTVSGSNPANASPVSAITFPAAQAGSAASTATFFSVGSSATGAGKIFYSGSLSPSIAIAVAVTPQLTTSTVLQET